MTQKKIPGARASATGEENILRSIGSDVCNEFRCLAQA
jgi:hypothetical protein